MATIKLSAILSLMAFIFTSCFESSPTQQGATREETKPSPFFLSKVAASTVYEVGPGKPYSTIQSAVLDIPLDLTGLGVHEIRIDAGVYPEEVIIHGITTTPDDFVRLRAAPGDEHRGISGTGVTVVAQIKWGAIRGNTQYVELLDLELVQSDAGDGHRALGISGSHWRVENCLVRTLGAMGVFIYPVSENNTFVNCAIVNDTSFGENTGVGILNEDTFDASHRAYNTVAYNYRNGGFWNMLCVNCVVYSHDQATRPDYENLKTGSHNNASRDASAAVGTGNLINLTLTDLNFVDVTGFNFRINPGSVLAGAGADLSAEFTTDIDGETIIDWPIGYDFILTNSPPVANAGNDTSLLSEEAAFTQLSGLATDVDGDALTCRWLEGGVEILASTPVEPDGSCPLDLSSLSLGTHALTLEVSDGEATDTDLVNVTVLNTPPNVAPSGSGVYEINTDVTLGGNVSDFDGDLVFYEWSLNGNPVCQGDVQTQATGTPTALPDCILSGLGLGSHTVDVSVGDGVNPPVTSQVEVEIVDTQVPTLAPVADQLILWPPNHQLETVTITANAQDNSGSFTLSADITSSEPEEGLGDGDTAPDITGFSIDPATGILSVQLRAERSGTGDGRVYTVTITATDSEGNASTVAVEILVPKNKKKP